MTKPVRTQNNKQGSATAPKVTIRDVAEKAGVSPAAVSLTLSGRGRIGDDTRQHILETVAALNYIPPRHKRESSDWRVFTVAAGSGSGERPAQTIDIQKHLGFLQDEIDQRRQEGCDTGEVESLVETLSAGRVTPNDIEAAWNRLENLEHRRDYPFVEVSDWDEIQAERPAPVRLEASFSASGLYDRIYGGWLGRAVGCTLGRPLELLGDFEDVIEFLERGAAFPLDDFVPEILPHPSNYAQYDPPVNHFLRGGITGAPRDDDLDYSVLNLLLLEKHGSQFTSEQVAEGWLQYLSFNSIYTAERVAYANLVGQYGPPDSAYYRNPYREFIGAQIRADVFGYTAPGSPERAARMAWRDARISHVKNGIYGEMFISAMIAAAFLLSDVEEIIKAGLSVIPMRSRMAAYVYETIEQTRQSRSWQDVAAYITERCADYDPIHVLPNACLVVLALLWGRGDFERSITTAAMCGLDTDCNTATVGSITGVMNGASALPKQWTAPLNDRLESWVRGHHASRISDLAQRSFNVARQSLKSP